MGLCLLQKYVFLPDCGWWWGCCREDVRLLELLHRLPPHGRGAGGHGTENITLPHPRTQRDLKGTVHVCQAEEKVRQVDPRG